MTRSAARGPALPTDPDLDSRDRKDSEERVHQAEREAAVTLTLLETLLWAAPVGFGFVDREFRTVRLNQMLAAFNGLPLEQQLGRTVAENVPEIWAQAEPLYRRALDGEAVVNVAVSWPPAADPGAVRHRLVSYYPVRLADEVVGVGIVVVDITDLKQAEAALAASEEHFRMLAERTRDVVYRLVTTPRVIEYVSPAVATLTGYAPNDFYADPDLWMRLVHPDDHHLIDHDPRERAHIDQPAVVRWIRRDGSVLWTEHRTVPVFDANGSMVAIEGTARDVTRRVEADHRLRASEARFRQFLSDIDLGALLLDASGKVQFINDHLLRLLGRTRDEVLWHDWIEIAVPAAERSALRALHLESMATGRSLGRTEVGIVTRSGEERRLAWTSVVQQDPAGEWVGLAGIAYDVTDARQKESERAMLAAAIEQSAESVVITDKEARITYVNRAFEHISGYAASEVIGRNPRLLRSGVQSATFYEAMWAALANGLPWVADMTNRRKDGSRYQLASVTSPIRSADTSITAFVNVGRDISHERELEARMEILGRERALIADTLRRLRPGGTLEATAELICRQVNGLTEVVVTALLLFNSDGSAAALAYVASGSPDVDLRRLTAERSRYLRDRADAGPWVESWIEDPTHPYDESLRRAGVRAFGYAPVAYDGSVIGVLAVGSADDDAVTQLSGQLAAIVEFADLAGALLGHGAGERLEVRRLGSIVEGVIARHAFTTLFQPIVDLSSSRTFGSEALTRFDDGVAPDIRFADAAAVGMGLDLERATLEAALVAAHTLSRSRFLHLNVTPGFVLQRTELKQLLGETRSRIVLEVAEHAAVRDYPEFRDAIASIGRPVCLAVDDAGAGFASFRHILELRPAFIKLDVSLVRGIDADPAKQALVAGMRHFARMTGRRLIADGIETEAEAATLGELEIRLGQGNLFGRPAPLAPKP